jgi:hypothetical protein
MQMQRECKTNTVAAEAAMHAAVSKVSAVTEQLNKETAARESLQGAVRDLREERRQCQQEHQRQVSALEHRYQAKLTHVRAALYFSLALLCVFIRGLRRGLVFSRVACSVWSRCAACVRLMETLTHLQTSFLFFYS